MKDARSPTVLLIHGSGADHWAALIGERNRNIEVISTQYRELEDATLARVEGIIGWHFPADLLRRTPGLRWIQSIAVGVEEYVGNPLISPGVIVTNTKGLYSDSVADYVMWSILTMTRKFDVVIRNQHRKRWRQVSGPTLKGKHLGILGLGSIGKAVATRARAFEMKTTGVVFKNATAEQSKFVDETVAASDLMQIVGLFDHLAVCIPLTENTRNIIDEKLIGNMKPSAYLTNASRSGVADEKAITKALRSGALAGAALDVFGTEPLRRWNKLWKTKNLLITPHIAAITDDYRERVGELICKNIERFSAGQTLLNIVDLEKGY
jgi:phosphoglycerate dehydrogenase-like enzyme